jgi:hypothetical protein
METPKGNEVTTSVSPMEAQMPELGGQSASAESREAAIARAMELLGGTVNKRGETAQRAANDFVD